MKLSNIFDVFSRRLPADVDDVPVIPKTTRTRVIIWCREAFGVERSPGAPVGLLDRFWLEICKSLQMRLGRAQLSRIQNPTSAIEDVFVYVSECETPEFLDFLEYIFRVDAFRMISVPAKDAVQEINELLRVDDVPFALTAFVDEQTLEPFPFGGRLVPTTRVREYPRAIARGSEVLHQEVTEPALALLGAPGFENAISEYLEALEDFRKGDYGDCLTKSGSSFESVMKVICDRKGWSYRQSDTAGQLVKTILGRTSLDTYLETPLLVVATLRNRLSKSHGAGIQAREISPHLAAYALHVAGAGIILLITEAGLGTPHG